MVSFVSRTLGNVAFLVYTEKPERTFGKPLECPPRGQRKYSALDKSICCPYMWNGVHVCSQEGENDPAEG